MTGAKTMNGPEGTSITAQTQVPAPRRTIYGYEPTDAEANALDRHLDRRNARRASAMPRLNVELDDEGSAAIRVEHENERVGFTLFMEAVATAERDFAVGLMNQLARAGLRRESDDATELNFALSVIKAIEPKDEIETMLAAQMAAIHSAVLTQAGRLANSTMVGAANLYGPGLNKLARTFTMQIEALKRYRSKGEQKVTVEHVHGPQRRTGNCRTHRAHGGGESKK
jgi:hypothetical protein